MQAMEILAETAFGLSAQNGLCVPMRQTVKFADRSDDDNYQL